MSSSKGVFWTTIIIAGAVLLALTPFMIYAWDTLMKAIGVIQVQSVEDKAGRIAGQLNDAIGATSDVEGIELLGDVFAAQLYFGEDCYSHHAELKAIATNESSMNACKDSVCFCVARFNNVCQLFGGSTVTCSPNSNAQDACSENWIDACHVVDDNPLALYWSDGISPSWVDTSGVTLSGVPEEPEEPEDVWDPTIVYMDVQSVSENIVEHLGDLCQAFFAGYQGIRVDIESINCAPIEEGYYIAVDDGNCLDNTCYDNVFLWMRPNSKVIGMEAYGDPEPDLSLTPIKTTFDIRLSSGGSG